MRIATLILTLLLGSSIPAQAQLLPALGTERAGTSGFQFLKVPVDARSAALGEAVVASGDGVSAMYWNPALPAWGSGTQLGLHHTAYFVDVVMDYVGVSMPLPGSNITIGASLQTMSSGKMDVTTEFQPFGTGETFQLLDMAAGLTFSQRLTDLFSYGITSKLVRESVAGLSTSTVVFDLGMAYAVGSTGLKMAVAIRNFGLDGTPTGSLDRPVVANPPVITETVFESLTPPTTFHLGVTYDAFVNRPGQSLLVSAQLNNPSDNAEAWSTGVEYGWNDTFFVRTGFRFGIEEYTSPAAGFGVQVPVSGSLLRFDYGFNRLERLGNVHRIGLNVRL